MTDDNNTGFEYTRQVRRLHSGCDRRIAKLEADVARLEGALRKIANLGPTHQIQDMARAALATPGDTDG